MLSNGHDFRSPRKRTSWPAISIPTVSILICTSVLFGPKLVGAEKPDFTGSYTLTGSKGAFKVKDGQPCWTIRVAQTENAMEITRVMGGEPKAYKVKLDGTESPYISPGGPTGTCTARLKGKSLVIDMVVTTRPQANGPAVQVHTRERWSLSSDAKTLTIRSDVDFPNVPLGGFQVVEPWSEIYTRD